MIGGILGILFTVTVAFSRIRMVEAKIAAPGAYLDMTKTLWGDAQAFKAVGSYSGHLYFCMRNDICNVGHFFGYC